MIEFKDINLVINNKQILTNINLIIPENINTVIIGKSGCGKTMLMKTMEGLFAPTSGNIIFDDIDLTFSKINKCNILPGRAAMLFQNAALLDSFTVFQNVALPLYEAKQLQPDEIRQSVTEMLKFVGLENSAELLPSELSGGMRKRIGLARSMMTNPKYVILDEPTTGLDPDTANEVISFLKFVIKEKSVIPITITHDPFCINELGEYIVIMDEGRIVFSGLKHELKDFPDKAIHRFYLS
jgi:phospholipid/cholesterol/gamma-HCH transport system ATP-binding protein